MTDVAKKGVTLLALAFAAFYLFSQPENAAEALMGAFDAVADGFHAIIRFFDALVA